MRLLDTEMPLRRLPSLYAAADAFVLHAAGGGHAGRELWAKERCEQVLPSRGEGWGRPHVEAMAMGLPVIATNWSGPTAFMSGETGSFRSLAPN